MSARRPEEERPEHAAAVRAPEPSGRGSEEDGFGSVAATRQSEAPASERSRDDHGGALAVLQNRRRLAVGVLGMVLAVVAIYILLPQVIGLDEALARLGSASPLWLAVAVVFMVASFAAYVALFRGVLGGTRADAVRRRLDMKASYEISVAGFAATRVFSAGGAGGIALTYWALRRAGMERRQAACRMFAFLVLLYSLYLVALVLFGILMRTGVLPGPAPFGGTIIPASVAGILLALIGLIALIPGDVERRLARLSGSHRRLGRLLGRLATGPATLATGVRTAIDYLRHPRRGALAVAGGLGYWAAQIGILWASFEAFGGDVAFAVLVQGFFVGMVANLLPSPAGGVGTIDAGMIGAFLLFGQPAEVIFPAVLAFRTIAFWLPIPPGIVAYFGLRRTVAGWEDEPEGGYASQSKVTVEAT
ncbi:MAG: YbhN family protein [Actinomycetota bacterium]|nr:YbhN family protein [Actinomycetota bacterium]